jgi:hypothetical protein
MANKTLRASLAATAATLASVAVAAFNEGLSRGQVIEAVRVAIGNSRSEKRFADVRARYIIGRMAARINSNAEPKLRIAGAEVAFNSVGATTAKVAKGKRRRSPEEQAAYDAARVAWSSILKDAGIKSRDKRGGGSDKHKNKRGATHKVTKKAKGANDNRQVAPKLSDANKIAAFLQQQAAMLLAFNNKNAKHMTLEQRNAIADFHAAIMPAKSAS